jgi:hypothetical protein
MLAQKTHFITSLIYYSSCGTVALYGPLYIFFFADHRATVFTLSKTFETAQTKSCAAFYEIYICFIVLAPDFMTKIGKKAAQDFVCAVSKVFDRVKTVALWSGKKHIYKGP